MEGFTVQYRKVFSGSAASFDVALPVNALQLSAH